VVVVVIKNMNKDKKITIAIFSSLALLIIVGIVASLTAAIAQREQEQQQSFAQVQELNEDSVSDFFDDHGYTVRSYEFRTDNGDLIVYAERTNRSVTAMPLTPAQID
jgi:sensor domain CHASE-containing protein